MRCVLKFNRLIFSSNLNIPYLYYKKFAYHAFQHHASKPYSHINCCCCCCYFHHDNKFEFCFYSMTYCYFSLNIGCYLLNYSMNYLALANSCPLAHSQSHNNIHSHHSTHCHNCYYSNPRSFDDSSPLHRNYKSKPFCTLLIPTLWSLLFQAVPETTSFRLIWVH